MTSKIKNILISQPKPKDPIKSPYSELTRKYNVKIDFHKFFTIEGVPAKDFRKQKVSLKDFNAIIFTSKNAVDHFFRICEEMRYTVPETLKYFCVSEATSFYLQKYIVYRKRKIFTGKTNITELIEVIKKHEHEKYLLPCSEIHKMDLPKQLDANKIHYKKALLYKTAHNDLSKLDIDKYQIIVFFSPSGIKSLVENFPDFKQEDKLIATFGTATTKAAKNARFNVEIQAPTPKHPSMTMALDAFLEQSKRATLRKK